MDHPYHYHMVFLELQVVDILCGTGRLGESPHGIKDFCHKENLRWTPMFRRWCSAAVWLKDVQKLRPGSEHHSIRRKIHRIFPQRSTVKRVLKSGFICYDQYHCVLPGWWKRNIGSIICFCRPLQYPWDLAGSSGEGRLSPAQCLWMWQTQPFGTQTWLVWEITELNGGFIENHRTKWLRVLETNPVWRKLDMSSSKLCLQRLVEHVLLQHTS